MKCYVCGKENKYCPNCAEFANAPSYLQMYDSEECQKIDMTLNKFWFNHLSKDQAKELLAGCNLGKVMNKDLLVAVNKLNEEDNIEEKKTFRKRNIYKGDK